jgi:hypothetical protein
LRRIWLPLIDDGCGQKRNIFIPLLFVDFRVTPKRACSMWQIANEFVVPPFVVGDTISTHDFRQRQ